jgi:uncharacterized protein DUF4168
MARPQANPPAIPQDLVKKVGAAAGQIARIQSDFATQTETETSADAREALAQRARTAAEQVIDEQGITVHDYNTVLDAAEGDQDLERRLLDAAREVL